MKSPVVRFGHRRGFLLVSVLLITVLLLIMGLAFLGKRAMQYRRAALAETAAQARALAASGLEDTLAKFSTDLEFPPLSNDQDVMTYTEEVSVGGRDVGSYTVTIDGTHRNPPYSVWVVTSRGEVGRPVVATRILKMEVDLSSKRRDAPTSDNPDYYRVVNFQDEGSL